ncbi:hypothetical protein [Intrasporangium sp.]|uniref:hypothetical protein n=1 Tax=Intrasporangium sp. TaxID=1925024 RepID=UPI002939C2F2|nr:hypothetical protein [Intrasporangium sp.]MDV3222841.1 hypothetical protein [Intrasporangium sp.]
MRVTVDPPRVIGGRVTYSWHLSEPSDLQHRNRFMVRFHGVPLRRFHRAVLWEVLLTLQLPVWARMGERVVVTLPEPVPEVVVDWWRAYHDAQHVEFEGPLTAERTYDPHPGRRRARAPADVAVSFGGGKDSTLALSALLDTREPQRVLLLHILQHFSAHPLVAARAAWRSRRLVVGPVARRTGVRTQLVTTNFIPTLTARGRAARPHVNLYTAATLPALLHHGARAVTVSRTAMSYRCHEAKDGSLRWANPSGRPERLRALGAYYRSVLGVELEPEGTHYAVGEFASFGSLLQLYPDALDGMVMCMRTSGRGRWCAQCSKCLEFALFGLALGHVAPDLAYDRLFHSDLVTALVTSAVSRQGQRSWHGNAPFVREIGTPSHFAAFCHAVHEVDLGLARQVMDPESLARLETLRQAWGRRPYPLVATIDEEALKVAGPLGQEVGRRAAEALGFSSGLSPLSEPLPVGQQRVTFRHGARMSIPLLEGWRAQWAQASASDDVTANVSDGGEASVGPAQVGKGGGS